MTRTAASVIADLLHSFASSTRYPTRTVEHAFAWIIVAWSYSVLMPGDMMIGPVFRPMLALMPEQAWGWVGLSIGLLRIAALITNGHWHPTPELRLIGALWGTMFWIALAYCYYVAIAAGAPDFPMRRAFYVLIFCELYSCYRCGQDMTIRNKKATSNPRGSVGAGYG